MIRFRGARTTVRDRVISMASKRMAFEEPSQGEPAAFERAVKTDGLSGVIGAGRVEAAAPAGSEGVQDRRKGVLVEEQEGEKETLQEPGKAPERWRHPLHGRGARRE